METGNEAIINNSSFASNMIGEGLGKGTLSDVQSGCRLPCNGVSKHSIVSLACIDYFYESEKSTELCKLSIS